jgi:hypothetical protein
MACRKLMDAPSGFRSFGVHKASLSGKSRLKIVDEKILSGFSKENFVIKACAFRFFLTHLLDFDKNAPDSGGLHKTNSARPGEMGILIRSPEGKSI